MANVAVASLGKSRPFGMGRGGGTGEGCLAQGKQRERKSLHALIEKENKTRTGTRVPKFALTLNAEAVCTPQSLTCLHGRTQSWGTRGGPQRSDLTFHTNANGRRRLVAVATALSRVASAAVARGRGRGCWRV
jgi:hypothetical protein